MSEFERTFELVRSEDRSAEIDGLIRQGKIQRSIDGDGHEKLYPVAEYFFEELLERDLDELGFREIAYVLESRGLLQLRRKEQGWVWLPTLAGRRAGLCSKKRVHIVLQELGLVEEMRRSCRLHDFQHELNASLQEN